MHAYVNLDAVLVGHVHASFLFSVDQVESIRQDELPLPILDSHFHLAFGSDNRLGQPVSMRLKVINTSAIPTSMEVVVSHFPAAPVCSPAQQGS